MTGVTRRVVLLSGLSLSACAELRPPVGAHQSEGFQPYTSPRSFGGPGQVFRTDEAGVPWPVETLQFATTIGSEFLPKYVSSLEYSLEALLQTIGVTGVQLPASLSANAGRSSSVTLESTDASRLFVDDRYLDEALQGRGTGLRIRPGNSYFVVREAIQSKALTYKVQRKWLASFSAEADFIEVVKTKASPKLEGDEELSVEASFSKPMFLMYRADQLKIEAANGGAPNQFDVTRNGSAQVRL